METQYDYLSRDWVFFFTRDTAYFFCVRTLVILNRQK